MLRSKNGKWWGGLLWKEADGGGEGGEAEREKEGGGAGEKRRRDKDQMRHAGRLRNGVREMLFQAHT